MDKRECGGYLCKCFVFKAFFLLLLRRFSVKAVADGAVSFFIDHHVMARVAKISYGAPCSRTYNASDPEHVKRADSRYQRPSGDYSLPGGFSTILPKVGEIVAVH